MTGHEVATWLFRLFTPLGKILVKLSGKNRDDDKSLVSEIDKKIQEICVLSTAYWSKSNAELGLSAAEKRQEILLHFTLLSMLTDRLRIYGVNCSAHFLRLKQAITGGKFENYGRAADFSVVNVEIPKHAGAFSSYMNADFYKRYR
jgi:hypothetical protein